MLFKECIIITMKIKDFHQTMPERLRVMHVTMKIKDFHQTMPETLTRHARYHENQRFSSNNA